MTDVEKSVSDVMAFAPTIRPMAPSDEAAEKIIAQMTTDQASAMSSFEGLGFTPEAILRDHVKDEAGTSYDLVVFAHRVSDVAGRLEAYGLGDD